MHCWAKTCVNTHQMSLCQVVGLWQACGHRPRHGLALNDKFHLSYMAELTRLGIAVCACGCDTQLYTNQSPKLSLLISISLYIKKNIQHLIHSDFALRTFVVVKIFHHCFHFGCSKSLGFSCGFFLGWRRVITEG